MAKSQAWDATCNNCFCFSWKYGFNGQCKKYWHNAKPIFNYQILLWLELFNQAWQKMLGVGHVVTYITGAVRIHRLDKHSHCFHSLDLDRTKNTISYSWVFTLTHMNPGDKRSGTYSIRTTKVHPIDRIPILVVHSRATNNIKVESGLSLPKSISARDSGPRLCRWTKTSASFEKASAMIKHQISVSRNQTSPSIHDRESGPEHRRATK